MPSIEPSENASRIEHITTKTGRIVRVTEEQIMAAQQAKAAVQPGFDPARRADVLFRVRREEGHEISAWWMVGAFVGVSLAVIALLSFVPGGA